jgi:hypothetical protein
MKAFAWVQFIVLWGVVICFIPEIKDLLQALTQILVQTAGWIFYKSA